MKINRVALTILWRLLKTFFSVKRHKQTASATNPLSCRHEMVIYLFFYFLRSTFFHSLYSRRIANGLFVRWKLVTKTPFLLDVLFRAQERTHFHTFLCAMHSSLHLCWATRCQQKRRCYHRLLWLSIFAINKDLRCATAYVSFSMHKYEMNIVDDVKQDISGKYITLLVAFDV